MLHKATMTTVELDDGETTALIAELRRIIASDPFPMSPRICTLRLILAKLQPPTARPQPFPAPTRTGVPSHVLHRNRQR
jgi:hypothetical protein